MSWVKIVLALLALADALVRWLSQRQALKAGEDAAIARASQAILRRTVEGRILFDRIDALPARRLDEVLRELEGQ